MDDRFSRSVKLYREPHGRNNVTNFKRKNKVDITWEGKAEDFLLKLFATHVGLTLNARKNEQEVSCF